MKFKKKNGIGEELKVNLTRRVSVFVQRKGHFDGYIESNRYIDSNRYIKSSLKVSDDFLRSKN